MLGSAGTPILDRIKGFTRERAIVFGNYAEASPDVHHCISAAADYPAWNWLQRPDDLPLRRLDRSDR